MRVLLIDDDDFLRDLYVTKFTELGHRADSAADAKQALVQLKEADYDLILLDLIMPGMSGLELLAEMNKEGLKKKSKVVILSNQGAADDQTNAKAAGADGYFVKAESIPSDVVKTAESIIKG